MANPGVFFNGQQIITPGVASAVNDAAMVDPNPDFGNKLVIIGGAQDGKPNTELTFSNYEDARKALYGGDGLDACRAAFAPSTDEGMFPPSQVSLIRLDPATQAAFTLKDNSANSTIDCTVNMWGNIGNQVTCSVATGTKTGKLITVKTPRGEVFSQDNIANNLFKIQYTGAGTTATLDADASGNTVTLTVTGPGALIIPLDLGTYSTVKKLVDAMNSDLCPGFSANVIGGNNQTKTKNGIDKVTSQDVKTSAYTVTGNLVAIVNWLNSVSVITAVVHTGTMTPPINVTNRAANGGTDGNITNTQWSNAFTLLQSIECGFISALTIDPAIIAMTAAHVDYMSKVARSERRAFCGLDIGTTDDAVIAEAALINDDRVALVHLGYYDYRARGGAYGDQGGNQNNGQLVLYKPYIFGALIAGAFAGCAPGTPLTNKSLTIRGLERLLRAPADTDPLIQGGVLCVIRNSDGVFRVAESVSTWLNDTNYDKVEISTGVALDTVVKGWRKAVQPVVGKKNGSQALGEVISRSETFLRAASVLEPNGPGLLVGDANSPPWKNLTATANGSVIQVQAQVSPAVPANYILVTVFAVPYSGTVTAQ